MKIAVVGGTGAVGRHVVRALSETGHESVVLTRSTGVDILDSTGLQDGLAGVDGVIDVSSISTTKATVAIDFFSRSSNNLIEAGRRAGVRHHVMLSIVGIDLVGSGYYLGKRAQEEVVLQDGNPVTVVRATQFHEFAGQMLSRIPGPFAVMPRMLSQPIAASEVGRHLVELVTGEPRGMAPELAGPDPIQMVEMARKVLRASNSRRVLVPLTIPGTAGRAMRDGALLPTGPGPRGIITFDSWLASAQQQAIFRG